MKILADQIFFSNGLNHYVIPAHMIEGLENYIKHRIRQGGFLHAVLANDLIEAVRNADCHNMANIPAFVNFLYNYAPPACFGSYDKVEKWLMNER